MTRASAIERIAEIDLAIDGVRRELRRRERVRPLSAKSWQRAWDKHPALHDECTGLFVRRGFLQLVRDQAEHEAYLAEQRHERARKAALTRLHNDMRQFGLAAAS